MIVSAVGLSTEDLEGHRLSWDLNLFKGKESLFDQIKPRYYFPSCLTSITQPASGSNVGWRLAVRKQIWWQVTVRELQLLNHQTTVY